MSPSFWIRRLTNISLAVGAEKRLSRYDKPLALEGCTLKADRLEKTDAILGTAK